jgi:hypothetical protein
MPQIRNSSVDNGKRQANKLAIQQKYVPKSRVADNYYSGAQNDSEADYLGSPKTGGARASSCMERLLRDEQRRRESRA